MPTCKNCQKEFTITDDDRRFYGEMNVPEPTTCPFCIWQHHCSFRNDAILYRRKSDRSGKELISHYSPEAFCPVYDFNEWNQDDWSALDYGFDYDFSRSAFLQFHDLQKKVPRPHRYVLGEVINSEYANAVSNVKNCYYQFGGAELEDCYYSDALGMSSGCVDCFNTLYSELSYEILNCEKCYHCRYLRDCTNCRDCYFMANCSSCHDCFGGVNLQHKEYCWFNQQLTKEQYFERLKEIDLGSASATKKTAEEFKTFYLSRAVSSDHNRNSENCSGDYLYGCSNCHNVFIAIGSENCKDVYRCFQVKDSRLISNCDCQEKSYQTMLCSDYPNFMYGIKFCLNLRGKCRDLEYCDYCLNCSDCLLSVGLRNEKFCILNKKYDEKEYFVLKEKIIKAMQQSGEYGQFFPAYCSPFAYNESFGGLFFPMSKTDALAQGYRWQENLPGVSGKETIKITDLPDSIKDTEADLVVGKILKCQLCKRNYKIINQEFDYYKKFSIPIPRSCPDCRRAARASQWNQPVLYDRICANDGQTKIKTTYAPDRPEKVYCEECYRKEIY